MPELRHYMLDIPLVLYMSSKIQCTTGTFSQARPLWPHLPALAGRGSDKAFDTTTLCLPNLVLHHHLNIQDLNFAFNLRNKASSAQLDTIRATLSRLLGAPHTVITPI